MEMIPQCENLYTGILSYVDLYEALSNCRSFICAIYLPLKECEWSLNQDDNNTKIKWICFFFMYAFEVLLQPVIQVYKIHNYSQHCKYHKDADLGIYL